ncbi:hypothetical protein [Algoriphagus sediminis]|uniref:Cellobiose phosphorylase n=1 Tax=Algoriphagus sediminis TaxID=3057113 RepID=A0ABT7YE62_9BACT|nr:hypothetical protein [Algoriphagus sediminis]MDN3204812.1 hypothetical protein [Algoriphagus sediminis]
MEYLEIEGEGFFKISDVDQLRPFFMSIVSDSDHWLFISSTGGLTAGRRNNQHSLFPYYSDDKITESFEHTGSKTVLKVRQIEHTKCWEPFSELYTGVYQIRRNLYKNELGNKIIFEEINADLGLTFEYSWRSSDEFGFVKTSKISNHSGKTVQLEILDGIQNILPHGVDPDLQQTSSNLIDAYKKCELSAESNLGVFSLSAIIVDKAEPSEALKANVVWQTGLNPENILISSLQLKNFRQGRHIHSERDIRAERGAYFTHSKLELSPKENKIWYTVANVSQGPSQVVNLSEYIKETSDISTDLERSILEGTENLKRLTYSADGSQLTSDKRRDARHFANTMFNIMRGGIFDDNYFLEKGDFVPYIKKASKKVFEEQKAILNSLPKKVSLQQIKELTENSTDPDFIRLAVEYLPLKFSRRHGDPSRPWNKFSINIKTDEGKKVLDYQGNWRDIFQNWEALAHSYPEFIQGMIYKFLNASTFDGYNPYRLTKDGFDWETIEPDDPWSYIGYWGDHQLIYLLKFLEFSEKHFEGELSKLFTQEIFVYANVPYKIKSFSEIYDNSKDTIIFDEDSDKAIRELRGKIGADGALLYNNAGDIHRVNFLEKILATLLAKTSNLIPEGGIWMNTQRPEWNDANNALVGNGISMVTLYYMKRFNSFLTRLLEKSNFEGINVSSELSDFFDSITKGLDSFRPLIDVGFSDSDRKKFISNLGTAGDNYRSSIYNEGFRGPKSEITKNKLISFCENLTDYLDHSIRRNERSDGMYHSYNLLEKNEDGVGIGRLSVMLEGQVAVLSSGFLSPKQSLKLLDSLRESALYRKDQNTYILYPNKILPQFLDRNVIPPSSVKKSILFSEMLENGNTQIIEKDKKGDFHFNGNFNNVNSLYASFEKLDDQYKELASKEKHLLGEIFEEVFNHKEFTGRSGTFYGYEGLGSIYWHMVSKLALAVQETYFRAQGEKIDPETLQGLKHHYYQVMEGIGLHKDPKLYGAFPTDPYSHTPLGKGAQQPGMTGQVKEDVLTRFGELGVFIKDNKIHFNPLLLSKSEFLNHSSSFEYLTLGGEFKNIELPEGSLAFTYCQIPILYKLGNENQISITMSKGGQKILKDLSLGEDLSKSIFERNGEVEKITVSIRV